MILSQIAKLLEQLAPLSLQESYDNAGLMVGEPSTNIHKALITLDITDEIMEEAIAIGANLIISHHPIIFKGIKKLNGKNMVERCVITAIKHEIAIYAIHTNFDNVLSGTNQYLADKLGLQHPQAIQPMQDQLKKLVVFVPLAQLEEVKQSLFEAGAGHIGRYDQCSFEQQGIGSFRALEGSNPFVGKLNERHQENEARLETIFPVYKQSQIIAALQQSHPYEEVAFDLYPLLNTSAQIGSGIVGELVTDEDEMDFLNRLQAITHAKCIKYTALRSKPIRKVALCGGSGAFLIPAAKAQQADIYITGDVKYHEFFDAENQMIIADIGHYESEQFTCKILYDYIKENLPTFAVQISDINTNPIKYL
jgi:dinuclear metal center YbgI/SA1388 family protein